MNIELLNRRLYNDLELIQERYRDTGKIDLTIINDSIEEIVKGAENCQEMINNRKKLSDEEFYQKLLTFAWISMWDWDEKDSNNVVELANKQKYEGETTIETTMTVVHQMREGHGRDFSYWNEEQGINYKILYTSDFKKDWNHLYTKEEIQKLIDEKKILILESSERSIECKVSFPKEKYYPFEEALGHYNKLYLLFDPKSKYYPFTLKYIRKNLGTKRLQQMLKEHLEHFDSELEEIMSVDINEFVRDVKSDNEMTYQEEYEKRDFAKRLNKVRGNN